MHRHPIRPRLAALALLSACSHEPSPQSDGSSESAAGTSTTDTTTDTTTGTETTGEPPCVQLAEDCQALAYMQYQTCKAACSKPMRDCADEQCHWGCLAERDAQMQACVDMHCPTGDDPLPCALPCYTQAATCSEDPSCSFFACSLGGIQCMADTCSSCDSYEFVIPYAGSCEVMLAGAIPLERLSFTNLDFQSGSYGFSWFTDTCDGNGVAAHWLDDQFNRFLLCPTVCDIFAQEGELVLFVGIECA